MIREIRKLTGLSYDQLGAWLGVSKSLVQFAEGGRRKLSDEAAKKLSLLSATMKQQQRATAKKSPGLPVYSHPAAFAQQHQRKMEHHQYQATQLQRQIKLLLQQHTLLSNRAGLLQAMQNIDTPVRSRGAKAKHTHITGLLEFFGQDKLAAVNHKLELLQDKLATHLAYADLHRKRWKEFKNMKPQAGK